MSKRLTSLDAFRGFTIAGMILINTIQDHTFTQLEHASWNGWTFADVVFPFFLWITGVTMVFSFGKRLKENIDKKALLSHVFKRVIILFLLGLIANAFPLFNFSSIRIPGVLQRIAVCYLFTSLIYLFLGIRGSIIALLALLSGYWILLSKLGTSFPQSVDVFLLGGHLWSDTFDPEGIISTIFATSTVLFGIVAGVLITRSLKTLNNTIILMVSGLFLIVLGVIVNLWLPINKNLWTSSFSIFMSGIAFVFFGGFYFFIERLRTEHYFQIFIAYGVNPLFLYITSSLLTSLLTILKVNLNPLIHIIFFYGIAYFLYRKKWFIKI